MKNQTKYLTFLLFLIAGALNAQNPLLQNFQTPPQCQEPLLPSGLMGLVVIFEEIMIKIN